VSEKLLDLGGDLIDRVLNLKEFSTAMVDVSNNSRAAGMSMAQFEANSAVLKQSGISAQEAAKQLDNYGKLIADLKMGPSSQMARGLFTGITDRETQDSLNELLTELPKLTSAGGLNRLLEYRENIRRYYRDILHDEAQGEAAVREFDSKTGVNLENLPEHTRFREATAREEQTISGRRAATEEFAVNSIKIAQAWSDIAGSFSAVVLEGSGINRGMDLMVEGLETAVGWALQFEDYMRNTKGITIEIANFLNNFKWPTVEETEKKLNENRAAQDKGIDFQGGAAAVWERLKSAALGTVGIVPEEPFVGPIRPEPFVGPIRPEQAEPFVGPMRPPEPFVGPVEPFVGPRQPAAGEAAQAAQSAMDAAAAVRDAAAAADEAAFPGMRQAPAIPRPADVGAAAAAARAAEDAAAEAAFPGRALPAAEPIIVPPSLAEPQIVVPPSLAEPPQPQIVVPPRFESMGHPFVDDIDAAARADAETVEAERARNAAAETMARRMRRGGPLTTLMGGLPPGMGADQAVTRPPAPIIVEQPPEPPAGDAKPTPEMPPPQKQSALPEGLFPKLAAMFTAPPLETGREKDDRALQRDAWADATMPDMSQKLDGAASQNVDISGTGRISVDVRAPSGTNVTASAEGFFKSTEIVRQTQMMTTENGPAPATGVGAGAGELSTGVG
jgi:hypothetical protein